MSPERGYRTVLWDLDGTLVGLRRLPFKVAMPAVAAYVFRDLVAPHRFLRVLSGVVGQARANDGELTNTALMVRLLAERTGLTEPEAAQRFRVLADEGFPRLRFCFPPLPAARDTVTRLAETGVTQVVATNPMWPDSTVLARLRWGGYDPAVFAMRTSGENMTRSKPRTEFYTGLLDRLGATARDCVMVGNDPVNDAPAALIGIPVFLVGVDPKDIPTDCARTGLVETGPWPALHRWLGIEEEPCLSS
ncbi:HAD family hydrolase [Nocardia puris]|uniref:FMN phosphatase YigB (HAD superfamily) n=1 Tax=Nocardia puris TaxID=208602 RepID=A0A366CVI4_9NOCA|nr:HAD family hydrolase [Nocardia puris]MBF6215983.1 HAD family hydrolase [Nocardia puris]MBF6370267.1 HAD family hydrolase [Nocardia puris]MBF6463173.1 HAD family hydrolase [Nocardia puris]RBO80088.1 FMN phosphatase YigB (HAD superfamily) [Nocardia puris]